MLLTRLFDVAKFTILTPSSLLSMYTLIPNCRSENILPPQFCIKLTKQNFHMVLMKMTENLFQFLIKLSSVIFLLSWCMHIENNITPATPLNYICHPITNKFNCRYYSVVHKKSCSQLMIFFSFSIEKNTIPCSKTVPFAPPNFCTSTKSNL